jgi:hypothetical protein
MSSSQTFSVNGRAAELVDRVKGAAAELKVAVARGELGETLISELRARWHTVFRRRPPPVCTEN